MLELLRRYWRRYRTRTLVGMGTKVVEVLFDLMTPVIVASMIDVGVATHDTGYVVSRGLLLVCLTATGYCFTLVCQKMAALVSQGLGTDLRRDLFRKVNDFGADEVDRFGTPSLVTRTTNDVNQVQVAVALGIRQLIRWPILAVGSVVAALLIDLPLGLIFLVCTPLIGLVFWIVMGRSIPYFSQMQDKLDRLSLITREALSGVRVVRAFRREGSEERRFDEAARDQAHTAITVGRLSALLNPASFMIMNLGVVAIIWAGGFRVDAGLLTQGQIVAFVNYMTQTLLAVAYVANLVVVFNRGAASARRILEVLDTEPAVRDEGASPVDLAAVPQDVAAVAFDHVSFAYGPGEDALCDVSFSLGQGQTLGVIGGTGSGKSTLVSLLARLYDAREGSVSVLGRDVRAWPLAELRHVVATVPQQASLVSGTLRQNLLWRDPDATDDDLLAALDTAQATDFVMAKEGGLDQPVEAGGRNFSGGQRQRLTIARALLGHPPIVVLDDSASALDFATDARLRAALRALGPGMTSVIVSQRVSAVMGADQVLVLHHGAVAGLGTHDELLRTCPIYREICDSQLKRGEED